MAIIGIGDVKPYLNIQGTVSDTLLVDLIDQAQALVETRCGPLEPTLTTYRVRASGDAIVLPVAPIQSVTSVTLVESGTALTLDDDDVNLTAGVIDADGICGRELYDVVCLPGRATCPEPLKRAVVEMVRYLWRPQQGPTVRQGDAADNMAALRLAETLMAPYRMHGFA